MPTGDQPDTGTGEESSKPLVYKPSVFYFRKALRGSKDHEEAIAVGVHVCAELEELKAWVREMGLTPPKWHLMREEVDEKGWGEVVDFPSPPT